MAWLAGAAECSERSTRGQFCRCSRGLCEGVGHLPGSAFLPPHPGWTHYLSAMAKRTESCLLKDTVPGDGTL